MPKGVARHAAAVAAACRGLGDAFARCVAVKRVANAVLSRAPSIERVGRVDLA